MIKTIAFFNNKGGVGKTSLAYHVSWMLQELNYNTLSVDLDPQANLTRMFMDESKVENMMEKRRSIYSALEPLKEGTGDIQEPSVFIANNDKLGLLPGDLNISKMDGDFSDTWSKCLDKDGRAFRVTTAFYRLIISAGKKMSAKIAVIDMGPNLGAINRAVLIASDYVIFPLGPDLFSYQGLKNVGEVLSKWREEWKERKLKKPENLNIELPQGNMTPLGYIMMRHSIRHDKPVKAYQNWIDKMPTAYNEFILKKETASDSNDQHLLAHLKDYRSLMPMAMAKTKPMFMLKPGDGAIGAHYTAVQSCYDDFKKLTEDILSKINQ